MSVKISPLSYTEHGQVKIKTSQYIEHVSTQQVMPLIVHEFAQASYEMPVVFIKNSKTGEFESVGLLGFKPGDNIFYSKKGWRGNYIPAYVGHHPFALMPSAEDETKLQVIIYESSDLVNDQEGEALFDSTGKETEYLEKRKNILGNYYENAQVSKAFINTLNKMDLLIEQTLTINFNDEKMNINGVYLVDEKKLNELSDEDFLSLRKKNLLAPIYNHLRSLYQLNNLAKLKTEAAKS